MQDKEFDDLFRSKLDNFEVEPSAQVWQNIDDELDGGKKKRILPILSIAASVLLLVTAGIILIPEKGTIKRNDPDRHHLSVKMEPEVTKPENIAPANTSEKKQALTALTRTPVKHNAKADQLKDKISPVEQKQQSGTAIVKIETAKPDEQPVLAAAGTENVVEDVRPVSVEPDPAPAVVKQASNNSTISIQTQPALASTPMPAAITAKPAIKKRGIHNLGDLVNLVVAKVDKRKDKLIQFSDNDDDESVISGVHLGVLKIKKDN